MVWIKNAGDAWHFFVCSRRQIFSLWSMGKGRSLSRDSPPPESPIPGSLCLCRAHTALTWDGVFQVGTETLWSHLSTKMDISRVSSLCPSLVRENLAYFYAILTKAIQIYYIQIKWLKKISTSCFLVYCFIILWSRVNNTQFVGQYCHPFVQFALMLFNRFLAFMPCILSQPLLWAQTLMCWWTCMQT